MNDCVTITVNGETYEFTVGKRFGQMPYSETLLQTLRERLQLTGAKIGCDQGACGCCSVLINGEAVASCMMLTADCDGLEVTTIEGLADKETGNWIRFSRRSLILARFSAVFARPASS